MEVTGRDGRLESILEVRSLELNYRVEGMSRFMDRQRLQMWRGAAWKRRGNVLQTVGMLAIDTIGARSWRQIRGRGGLSMRSMRSGLRISEQRKQRDA